MIDIHSHILPRVDDGPSSDQAALEMAVMASQDGIQTMIATPHIHIGITTTTPALIRERVSNLNNLLIAHNINLTIIPGAEVAYDADRNTHSAFLLNNGPYILIEFPHTYLPGSASNVLYELQLDGYSPIIAHPERNPSVIKNPNLLQDLLVSGVTAQLTAESITGEFGPAIQQCAHYLLRRNRIHFIATDSHSVTMRKPLLSRAMKFAAKIIGSEAAGKLVNDHPAAVLRGDPIPGLGV